MNQAYPERITEQNALEAANAFIRQTLPYPGQFYGRGIVICGGGVKYFTNAWVCINMLRKLGCYLPIQIWHLGGRELDDRMRALVRPFNVQCVDGTKVRQMRPARILNGWELKPYAILNCPFQEVLLLDADNVPVVNPEFLFETAEYLATGAIFWPDFSRLEPDRMIWGLCGVEHQDEPEFESGQMVIDKERCWEPMSLCSWYNEYSDFFYEHIHGDKETFHLAFRKLKRLYAMPKRGIDALEDTMCQHDFQGHRLFQHRNMDKWSLGSENKCIEGFQFEGECREFIQQLRNRWNGRIYEEAAKELTPEARAVMEFLTGKTFDYHRVGHDRRSITLLEQGMVGSGSGELERFWELAEEDGQTVLQLWSLEGLTCSLRRDRDGVWRGRWNVYERMPIELKLYNQETGVCIPS